MRAAAMPRSPHFLTSARTELHPFADEDGPELLHLFRDPDVRNFLLDDRLVSPAWMQQEIGESDRRFRRHGAGAWSVRLPGDDEIIGFVAFREFANPPELQLLYGFLPAHWGKGYAAEVTTRVCEHAFTDLGLDEITAVTDLPNTASAKLLQRLGMELMEVRPDGAAGTAHYAITRQAWRERQRVAATTKSPTRFSDAPSRSAQPPGAREDDTVG